MDPAGGGFGSLSVAADVPLVGRVREREVLGTALAEALRGQGSAWLIEGPGGMGKTSLVRWLEGEAGRSGFRAHWGYALKEVNTPFFPWQQLFRGIDTGTRPERPRLSTESLPSLLLFEEERPQLSLEFASRLALGHALLVMGRDRPPALQKRWPSLGPPAQVLVLSREGSPGSIAPGNLDAIADQARSFLEAKPGSVFVLTGFDYLLTHNEFTPTLHLVEFLRDLAEGQGGHVLLSLNPESLERRQLALVEGVGQVVRAHEKDERPTAPAPSSPTEIMIGFLDAVERGVQGQPLLLALDDLQWADPPSIRAYHFLARNLRRLPVVLVATVRTDDAHEVDPQKERALQEAVEGMEKEGLVRRLSLAGMGEPEARELLHQLLGVPLAAGAHDEGVRSMLRRSEGNPFFLKESLRRLADEGLLTRQPDGVHLRSVPEEAHGNRGTAMVPLTLRRLVARRLDRLSPEERDLLDWAAVAGSRFDRAPLEALWGGPAGSVPMLLQRLEQQEHLIEEQEPGTWTFGHPLVWEVLRLELSDPELQSRARRLVAWWALRRPDDLDTVARLYHEGRMPGPGVPWLRRSIEHAVRTTSLDVVERYHGWMQDLLNEGSAPALERVEAGLDVVALLCQVQGNTPQALGILRLLLPWSEGTVLRADVEAFLALNLTQTRPRESAEIVARWGQGGADQGGISPRARGILGLSAAVQCSVEGRFDRSREAAAQLLASPGALPAWVRVRALYILGSSEVRSGVYDAAEEHLQSALALLEGAEGSLLRGYCRNLEALLAEARGMSGETLRAFQGALEIARTVGSPTYLCIALLNVAEASIVIGDLKGARTHLQELRKQAERFLVERARDLSVPHMQGLLELHDGRPGPALERLRGTITAMERGGDVELLQQVRLEAAQTALLLGDADSAQHWIRQVEEHRDQLHSYLGALLPLVRGWWKAPRAAPDDVRAEFERALAIAREAGSVLYQGVALGYLARWDEAFGEATRAERLWAEAKGFFDRSGVLPGAWARSWPPPLPPPSGSASRSTPSATSP